MHLIDQWLVVPQGVHKRLKMPLGTGMYSRPIPSMGLGETIALSSHAVATSDHGAAFPKRPHRSGQRILYRLKTTRLH